MLKLKLQYFGHLMQRTDSLENTLMLGKTDGRRRMRWLVGITGTMGMSLSTSSNSGSWWWTGKPDVLQSMESQRVRHDWTTAVAGSLCSETITTLWIGYTPIQSKSFKKRKEKEYIYWFYLYEALWKIASYSIVSEGISMVAPDLLGGGTFGSTGNRHKGTIWGDRGFLYLDQVTVIQE